MAQTGLHGLTGLLIGEALLSGCVQSSSGRRTLVYGYVLGNLLPDLDLLAAVATYPANPLLALQLHRGFTHSILAVALVALSFFLASKVMAAADANYLGLGLALGIFTHILEDILIWFSPVDLFWPASLYGLLPPVNLWAWFPEPPLVANLLGAAEFAAFAFYFDHLAQLAASFGTDPEMIPPLRRAVEASWAAWAFYTILATVLPEALFNTWLYLPVGLVFAPICAFATWRMQSTIEFLVLLRQGP